MPQKQRVRQLGADPAGSDDVCVAANSGPESPQPHRIKQVSRLNRQVFATVRLLEFCSERELIAQTGHPVEDWPLVIPKELIDNAIDACEEADIAPDITIMVSTATGEIAVSDNGPGIPNDT